MVVKLTKEQADYLETFKGQKGTAIYYIARWGWSHFLEDGLGKVYETKKEAPFNIDEKEKMLNALINGYEVILPKFKFYNFSNSSGNAPLYYAGKEEELTNNETFAKEVEKDSEEYIALEKLGFFKG